jgi:hypothetical protein
MIPPAFPRARTALLLFAATVIAASCASAPVAQAPLDEPEQRPAREVITWEISPKQGHVDEFGFVRLDFQPPGSAADLPPGGRLTVHLGRLRLDHANTIWYSFAVTEGRSPLVLLIGQEGIPNVKGPDGNWWNDVILDVPSAFPREVRVEVRDGKTGLVYAFTVRKVVEHEEPS